MTMTDSNQINYRYLPAKKIIPKDDTFHGSKYFIDIEWWYFDAVFDNEISVHIGFRIYHIREFGILQTRINIYKKGKLIKEKIKRNLLNDINIDINKPNFIINDKKIISFNENINNKKINNWSYTINDIIDDVSVNLTFSSLTEGWKIETASTCWTVPLPSAQVKGDISIDGKTIQVKGTGYHDHNWGYSPTTVLQNIGWYWGRISTETLHTTWANTMASKTTQDLIVVVNRPYSTNNDDLLYNSIHPNNITFNAEDYKENHKLSIPHSFTISFNQKNNDNNFPISANLKMKTTNIHYDKIFIINYWRYHVNVSGTIQYGDIIETIKDKPQIIEYLRF